KNYGYIIIPVVVAADADPAKALDDNRTYKVVWSVLNALRAHDDRFNATINKIELNRNKPHQILVGTPGLSNPLAANQTHDTQLALNNTSRQLAIQFEQLQSVVFAKMVQKVGDRRYWEQWAKNVAEIAERQMDRIQRLISEDGTHQKAFAEFLNGLRKNINPSISQQQAVEMLSQHIITRPVFDALFEGYSFVRNNPISISMQKMLDLLEAQAVAADTATLDKFYDSVKQRAQGIDNAAGKQRIIIELYDKFFKTAFPKMVEQLGIVYTPVEVVDFIIHSVNDVLQAEFDRTLSDKNIHILDPFTGTGTFITRLLQSGLIDPKDAARKYTQELHANEIVLLAYYIAAVNIENAFHDMTGNDGDYLPFDGICLTDTFQLGENTGKDHLFSEMFPRNSARVEAQKNSPIRVIIGNPPYSVGQKSANDNAQNQSYMKLDSRIADTYAKETSATNKNSLYDSYIKAFRWAADRLDAKIGGIICFVSNGAWLDGNATSGFRKCIEKEFSAIYVFNLRGNARTQGEVRRSEAGNVFGGGSRTPIAITLLVKKAVKSPLEGGQGDVKATIHYHDIGDYLSQKEKLARIQAFGSVKNPAMPWQKITSNEHGDWLNQRNDLFKTFFALGDKKELNTYFQSGIYCRGLETARDSWVYSSSSQALVVQIKNSIAFYNHQLEIVNEKKLKDNNAIVRDIIEYDDKKISWSRSFITDISNNKHKKFTKENVREAIYRPFTKQFLYFSREQNNVVSRMDSFFPTPDTKNRVIC
ncbi:DEAD/DEAH box helicase, partial [bacterium]|nr:DEAD/DEAH box helicase [bacterium]